MLCRFFVRGDPAPASGIPVDVESVPVGSVNPWILSPPEVNMEAEEEEVDEIERLPCAGVTGWKGLFCIGS